MVLGLFGSQSLAISRILGRVEGGAECAGGED